MTTALHPSDFVVMMERHEARRKAYYAMVGGLEYALSLIKQFPDHRAAGAEHAVLASQQALYEGHLRATEQEDAAVRAYLRAEASMDAFLESGAPDAR